MNNLLQTSTIISTPSLIVVDNFYKDPNKVRDFALQHLFQENPKEYKGVRTKERHLSDSLKTIFESLIGSKISTDSWHTHQYNGCFQATSAENNQVYHHDDNHWAGIIYLTPNAPIESGTTILKSKSTGIVDSENVDQATMRQCFETGFYDSTAFDVLDSVGNVFNRLVLFKSTNLHAAGPYFGKNLSDGRLIHLFFFDLETSNEV